MLIISKEFNATPKQVFNAWSKAESIVAWWGPEGFTTEVKTFDFKPGGTFHYVIKDGKGMDMWGLFSYQEIREPNHLIFINSFSNPAAEVVKAPEVPFGKHWPLKMINTLRLDEKDGITTLELTPKLFFGPF